MAATKNLVLVLTALLLPFSSSSTSSAAATNGLSQASTDSVIREALFLNIEDARNTGDFLVVLSALESVRNGRGGLRECIAYLLTTVQDIQFRLETIWGNLIVNPGNLPNDITVIRYEIEKIEGRDNTCSNSLDAMNDANRKTLMNRLTSFRTGIKEAMNLVGQINPPSLAAESGEE